MRGYLSKKQVSQKELRRIRRNLLLIFIILILIGVLVSLRINPVIYQGDSFALKLSTLLGGVLIFLAARFLDWVISKLVLHNYYLKRDQVDKPDQPIEVPKKDSEKRRAKPYNTSSMSLLSCSFFLHSI